VAFLARPVAARSIPIDDRLRAGVRDSPQEFAALVPAGVLVTALVAGIGFQIGPLATAATFGALVTAVAFPYAGLIVAAFTASMVPPAFPAPGFQIALVAALLLGCLYRLPIDRPRLSPNPVVVILGAYALFALVQQIPELASGYASDDAHAVGFLYIQLLGGIGTLIAAGYIVRARSPYPVLAAAVAGAALTAIVSVATFVTAPGLAPLLNLAAPSLDFGRATGPFSNPNYLGAFAAIMATVTFALLVAVRWRLVQVALAGSLILLIGATALSLSRGAAVAALVGFTVVIVSHWRRAGVALLALGAIGAVVGYPLFVQWRLESLTGSASAQAYLIMSDSDAGRLAGVLAAPALFLTAPLFGIGFGHFVAASVQTGLLTPINAHNWYLTVLAEQGVVGVLLWAGIAVAAVDTLRRSPPPAREVGVATLAALATAALFLEPPTTLQLIAVPLIVLAASGVAVWAPVVGVQLEDPATTPELTARINMRIADPRAST
jgi:O-antigen ligase